MECLIISYDVDKETMPNYNYGTLHRAIKSYGDWLHLTESTWAVYTEHRREAILADLRKNYIPHPNYLVVVGCDNNPQGDFITPDWRPRGSY